MAALLASSIPVPSGTFPSSVFIFNVFLDHLTQYFGSAVRFFTATTGLAGSHVSPFRILLGSGSFTTIRGKTVRRAYLEDRIHKNFCDGLLHTLDDMDVLVVNLRYRGEHRVGKVETQRVFRKLT